MNIDNDQEGEESEEDPLQGGNVSINYLAGVIDQSSALKFKRLLYRITRGTVWTIVTNIKYDEKDQHLVAPDPKTGEIQKKSVFLVVYSGKHLEVVQSKLMRCCKAFNCTKYAVPKKFNNDVFERKIIQI